MSGAEIAQIITSLATLVAAAGAIVIGLRNIAKIDRNSVKLDEVHTLANGLTAKLVAKTADASEAEGNLKGRAELKQEQSAKKRG